MQRVDQGGVISRNGEQVGYISFCPDPAVCRAIVPDDTNDAPDVFVRDF